MLIHATLGLCSAGGGTVGSGSGAPVGLEKALLTGGRKAEALQVKHALVVAKTRARVTMMMAMQTLMVAVEWR